MTPVNNSIDADYVYINYDDYEYDDVFKKIYNVSVRFNIYLQVFTIVVNLFHFVMLTRKDLRSISIYMIMIVICISDIISFTSDFYNTATEIAWIPQFFSTVYELCLDEKWSIINPPLQIIATVSNLTKRLSVWLAILLALIRTLSVAFPMKTGIQKLTKPKTAVFLILVTFLFWFIYTAWPLTLYRIVWILDNLNKECGKEEINSIIPRYVLVSPAYLVYLMNDLGFLEIFVKVIPAALYPILTFVLIYQLRSIKKRRNDIQKKDKDKSDSTTKLILFMTITFTLSEGLGGLADLLMYNMEHLTEWNDEFALWVMTSQYLIINLRTLNAASHVFVCFFMSSQYREVVKTILWKNVYCSGKRKIRKVDKTLTAVSSKTTKTSSVS